MVKHRQKNNSYLSVLYTALLVIIGSIIRFWFGYYHEPWNHAPDQLAWWISIEDMLNRGVFSYRQLIHYPHEGGTALLGLMAVALRPLGFLLHPLSLASLLADSLSRWIQIILTMRMTNQRTGLLFGLWSVFAVPLLLPWAVVNFGLHSLSAFWPFVFTYVLVKDISPLRKAALAALVLGAAVSFSYDNLVMLPVFLVWLAFTKLSWSWRWKSLAMGVPVFLLAVFPHLLLRLYADTGFHLEHLPLHTVRQGGWGTVFSREYWGNYSTACTEIFPSSFFLSSLTDISLRLQRWLVLAFLLAGIGYAWKRYAVQMPAVKLMVVMLLAYLAIYALSPFYLERSGLSSYVSYRHLAYILPMAIAVILLGLAWRDRLFTFLTVVWIGLCILSTWQYLYAFQPTLHPAYREAGWVLVRKYGHDPQQLARFTDKDNSDKTNRLYTGYGWGLTATLLENRCADDADSSRYHQLIDLLQALDEDYTPYIHRGVRYAFSPGITPVLDTVFLPQIRRSMHWPDSTAIPALSY